MKYDVTIQFYMPSYQCYIRYLSDWGKNQLVSTSTTVKWTVSYFIVISGQYFPCDFENELEPFSSGNDFKDGCSGTRFYQNLTRYCGIIKIVVQGSCAYAPLINKHGACILLNKKK